MVNLRTLGVSIKVRTGEFQKGLRRVQRMMRRFSRTIKRMARRVALFGGSLAALAGGFSFIRLLRGSERFNQAMRSSQAIMGDLDDAMRRTMKDTAFEVARATKVSAEEAARSYFYLASAGLDAQQSVKALSVVAKFAQAGMFDMALATDLLTDAQSALGLSAKDAVANYRNMLHISDVLVKANTVANASVQQFSEALTTKAGAALRFLNKDVEEGVAILAAFADQGIKGAEAGTALNIIFRDMTTKALQNAKAFSAAGVAVFDAAGQMQNIADIIGDLERHLEGLSDAEKKAAMLALGFSDKSIVFQQALIGSSEKVRQFEEALRSAGGMTQEVADKQLTPFAKAWARLSASAAQLGDALSPVIDGFAVLMDTATLALDTITKKLKEAGAGTKEFGSMIVNAAKWVSETIVWLAELAANLASRLTYTTATLLGNFKEFVDTTRAQFATLATLFPWLESKLEPGWNAFTKASDALSFMTRHMRKFAREAGLFSGGAGTKALLEWFGELERKIAAAGGAAAGGVGGAMDRVARKAARAMGAPLGSEIRLATTPIQGLIMQRQQKQQVHDAALQEALVPQLEEIAANTKNSVAVMGP